MIRIVECCKGIGDMKIEALKDIANDFLLTYYQVPLEIPIERNNRFRTTQGRYVMKHDGTPLRIDLSGSTLDYGTEQANIGIWQHECIRDAFNKLTKPNTDDTPIYKQ